MTTAIYLRISSADVNTESELVRPELVQDSNSIKNQRDLLTSFVKNHSDLCNTKMIEICDDGYSGTNFDRPGIKKMLEFIKNGGVNCIIVKDFSRFGRNYIEAGNYIEQVFPFLGVRFISVNDGYDSNKEDISAGNINVAFINLIHDLYAKDISEKVKTSQKLKWEKGENIAGRPIFGYVRSETDKHKIVVDEKAAAVVRQIFDMAVKGIKVKDIAKNLNDSNTPTPNEYGRVFLHGRNWKITNGAEFWNDSTLRRILADERYTGKSICGKWRRIEVGNPKYTAVPQNEWFIKENAFEAVISKEIFEKAQKKTYENSGKRISSADGNKTSKRVEKQRIIYAKIRCDGCGLAMKRQGYKNPVFVCKTPKYAHSPNCVQEKILESKIEKVLFETIRKQIEVFVDYDRFQSDNYPCEGNAELSESKRNTMSAQIQELQKLAQKFTQNRISLYERYKDGIIVREDYTTERARLTLQIGGIEKQIQALELEFEQILLPQEKPEYREYIRFSEMRQLTREMVDNLIESVIIRNDNRIEINLKYSGEFAEFTKCK